MPILKGLIGVAWVYPLWQSSFVKVRLIAGQQNSSIVVFDHVKTDLAEFKPYVLKQKCKRALVLFEDWVVVVEYREAVDNFYGGSKGVARECTLVETYTFGTIWSTLACDFSICTCRMQSSP